MRDLEGIAKALEEGPGFTWLDARGRVIASFGMRKMTPRVYEAWLICSDLASFRAIQLISMIRQHLAAHIRDLKPDRIQAAILTDRPIQLRLVKKILKFEYEGTLRKYLYGRDHYMFALIPPGG
jgi:hypothetical protein